MDLWPTMATSWRRRSACERSDKIIAGSAAPRSLARSHRVRNSRRGSRAGKANKCSFLSEEAELAREEAAKWSTMEELLARAFIAGARAAETKAATTLPRLPLRSTTGSEWPPLAPIRLLLCCHCRSPVQWESERRRRRTRTTSSEQRRRHLARSCTRAAQGRAARLY